MWKKWLSFLVVLGAVVLWHPFTATARAAEPDTRAVTHLDALFLELRAAENGADVRRAERRIWTHWLTYRGNAEGVRHHMRQGAVSMRARNFGSAKESFANAISADPGYSEAWNQRATVRWLRGDLAGSISDIAATLALEPRHFGALSGLGGIYLALDDLERAVAAFEQALSIHPNLRDVRFQLEQIRGRLNRLRI